MLVKTSDHWRNEVACEAERQFAAALEKIGKHLLFADASFVRAPLPERMTTLLDELRRRRARVCNRN